MPSGARADGVELADVVLGEDGRRAGDVLAEVLDGRGARDEQDVRRALEQPGQRHREGRGPDALRHGRERLSLQFLVERTVTPTVPVTVSYELTALGLSLHSTVRQLKLWSQDHRDEVAARQSAYDDAHLPAS
ncbi:transcriptional regulator [Humibacter sp. BT305]|nr:transcriptional regulator [Humibacter sp. BT305]